MGGGKRLGRQIKRKGEEMEGRGRREERWKGKKRQRTRGWNKGIKNKENKDK
jgi:hypothetical protein